MNRFKKALSFILALVMVFSVAAMMSGCDGSDEEGEKNIFTGKTKTGTKKQARIKAIDEAVGDNLNTWQINKLYDILN